VTNDGQTVRPRYGKICSYRRTISSYNNFALLFFYFCIQP